MLKKAMSGDVFFIYQRRRKLKIVKIKAHKWWSLKDRKSARLLTEFDNYILTRIYAKKGISWLISNPTTEQIKKVLKELK